MKALFLRFCADSSGTTAIEYALIGGIVSIAIVGALYEIGPAVQANFQEAADAFNK